MRKGKFVQIIHNNGEYLVLSPKELSRYHANIVERFCLQYKIDGYYDRALHKFEIIDSEWDVVGGGRWDMDEENKILHLFDNSQAYGRFDASDLREKVLLNAWFSGYKVKIE